MRIALLAAANNVHTIRWANGLYAAGLEVHLISQHNILETVDRNIHTHIFPFMGSIGYFTMVLGVKKILRRIKPDLVNAHYASGYGTTLRLAAYHPSLLSVWGSDVYDFPCKSFLHNFVLKQNLLSADTIASTSCCMAKQIKSLTSKIKEVEITPFGVDKKCYEKILQLSERQKNQSIVIGTVKTMSHNYGIDTLLHSFAILYKMIQREYPLLAKRLVLRIVGDGCQMQELQDMARQLYIDNITSFIGRIPSHQVPIELEKFDIYVALSRLESFGVAVIEASAAGRPVVVSDADGLKEVVVNNQTGLIVPRDNPDAAATALYQLVLSPQLRIQMGEAGRKHVLEKYEWSACVDKMIKVYKQTIAKYSLLADYS